MKEYCYKVQSLILKEVVTLATQRKIDLIKVEKTIKRDE